MPDRKLPNDDSRWSTREALDKPADDSRAWSLGHLRAKLKLLKYHPTFRKYRTVLTYTAVGAVLALSLLIIGSRLEWFSDRGSPLVTASPPQQPQGQGNTATSRGEAGGQTPWIKSKPSLEVSEVEAKKEPFPDDVTKWSKDDRLRARVEHDPRLLQAVAYLGTQFAGDESAAQDLAELLKPVKAKAVPAASPPPFEPPPFALSPKPVDYSKLVQAVVAALGKNGSPFARNVLQQVLAGSFATADDRAAVDATLETLIAHPGRENNAILAALLISPYSVRPVKQQGPWPARDVQARAVQFVQAAETEELRLALAERLGDQFFQLDPSDPVYALLDAADPVNGCAQLLLYEQALHGDAAELRMARLRLQQQLLSDASIDLSRWLGIPESIETPVGVSPQTVEKTPRRGLGWRFAAQLWSDHFAAILGPQLADLRSPESEPQLLLLAAAIPTDWARASLAKYLHKHWNEGPKILETAGLPERLVVDPGLLVLIKMLPRKEAKAPDRAARASLPLAPALSKAESARQVAVRKKEQKEQAEQDWMSMSSKMVATWCQRFRAAALARETSDRKAATRAAGRQGSALPNDFEFGRDVKVTAAYQLAWPQEMPAALGPVKPGWLEVHYVCVEETNRPKRALSFYNRQSRARLLDARPLNNSIWLDSLRTGSQKSSRRSTDVLVTRAPGDPGTADLLTDDSEAKLIVEILIIEIEDPVANEVGHKGSEGKKAEDQNLGAKPSGGKAAAETPSQNKDPRGKQAEAKGPADKP